MALRIVIAPDSFKGSLSALEAAQSMAEGVRRVFPAAETRLLPLADGGEGTLDAVLAARGGERHSVLVTGGHGRALAAAWGQLPDGTAVLEAAQVVGLTLPGMTEVPVARRTTTGLGELLRHVLDRGLRRFWIGLGGSATNDGGVGLLAALGARFFDGANRPLGPTPADLEFLGEADFSSLDPRLKECEILLLSDVDNVLCGPRGATAVFGPQKGVKSEEVAVFDQRLRQLAELADDWKGRRFSLLPGSGAAGGLGYAFLLLGGEYRSGAEEMADLLGLDAALARADWAFTGEGRSDAQTLSGKAPLALARRAKAAGVPATLISGTVDPAARNALSAWFGDCLSLEAGGISTTEAMVRAKGLLADAAEGAARTIRGRFPD